jgi:mRNA-degrading endonuclease RelE of RelBE toxin-antitoxin system
MIYNLETTDDFDKEIKKLRKKYPSIKGDFQKIIDDIEKELILATDLGEGFKKIRIDIKSKGKGASGGGRIITYETIVAVAKKNILFTLIYNKGDYDNLDLFILKKNLGIKK